MKRVDLVQLSRLPHFVGKLWMSNQTDPHGINCNMAMQASDAAWRQTKLGQGIARRR
jgi:hypothetical protein